MRSQGKVVLHQPVDKLCLAYVFLEFVFSIDCMAYQLNQLRFFNFRIDHREDL